MPVLHYAANIKKQGCDGTTCVCVFLFAEPVSGKRWKKLVTVLSPEEVGEAGTGREETYTVTQFCTFGILKHMNVFPILKNNLKLIFKSFV